MVWSLSLKKSDAEQGERWMRIASGSVRRAGSSPELLARLAMAHSDLLVHRLPPRPHEGTPGHSFVA